MHRSSSSGASGTGSVYSMSSNLAYIGQPGRSQEVLKPKGAQCKHTASTYRQERPFTRQRRQRLRVGATRHSEICIMHYSQSLRFWKHHPHGDASETSCKVTIANESANRDKCQWERSDNGSSSGSRRSTVLVGARPTPTRLVRQIYSNYKAQRQCKRRLVRY